MKVNDIKKPKDPAKPKNKVVKNAPGIAAKVDLKIDISKVQLKDFNYQSAPEEWKLHPYQKTPPAKSGLQVKATMDIKSPGKVTPAKPKVNSAPLFKKRVTT